MKINVYLKSKQIQKKTTKRKHKTHHVTKHALHIMLTIAFPFKKYIFNQFARLHHKIIHLGSRK